MCLGCLDIRIEYSFLIQYAVFKVRMPQALAFGDGDGEIRTHDPLLARQVLSQLSYTPGNLVDELRKLNSVPYL